jgi:hypothetical protein
MRERGLVNRERRECGDGGIMKRERFIGETKEVEISGIVALCEETKEYRDGAELLEKEDW